MLKDFEMANRAGTTENTCNGLLRRHNFPYRRREIPHINNHKTTTCRIQQPRRPQANPKAIPETPRALLTTPDRLKITGTKGNNPTAKNSPSPAPSPQLPQREKLPLPLDFAINPLNDHITTHKEARTWAEKQRPQHEWGPRKESSGEKNEN